MKKGNILLSIAGVLSASSFIAYLLLYNRLYHAIGAIADKLIFVPALLVLIVFIICVWRIFYNANRKFSASLFIPAAITIIIAILAFSLSDTITTSYQDSYFGNNQVAFNQVVTKVTLNQLPVTEGINMLPAPYQNLVPTDELIVYKTAGKDAYLFVTLDHSTRIEGYMYLPEGILRYEITNKYNPTVDPEFYQLEEDNWIWVCFYK